MRQDALSSNRGSATNSLHGVGQVATTHLFHPNNQFTDAHLPAPKGACGDSNSHSVLWVLRSLIIMP